MQTKVEGPIVGGSRGWPFAASMLDVASLGYEEHEYFISGTAARYRDVGDSTSRRDGIWDIAVADEAEYKTRLLVYRPQDPLKFNGTVVLVWNNVTAGHDLFSADSRELFGNGSALACLTVQKVGIEGLPPAPQGLRDWDPERYGSLSIPSDDYSYDIYTQAARVLGADRNTEIDPMGGLEVARVVAQGASQSAGRLATYINAVQPLSHAFDGFILAIYFGKGTPVEVGSAVVNINTPNETASEDLLVGKNQIRDDLGIPVFVVNSELESMACHNVRQADTDTFRYWESAGTCHVSQQGRQVRQKLLDRDGITGRAPETGINAIPMNPLYDAVFYHMQRWLSEGIAPPAAPLVEFSGNPPEIVRDEHGIAVGGIRLPQVEVPVATNSAVPLSADIFAVLGGSCHPFDADKLSSLYGDEATFITRFEEAASRAVSARFLCPRDVPLLLEEARTNWAKAASVSD